MTAALAYFIAMLVFMVPLIGVHVLCIIVTARYPGIRPDNGERWRYQRGEGGMAYMCLTFIIFMAAVLPYLETFCAHYPIWGLVIHGLVISGGAIGLVLKIHHLMRLIEQVKEL